MLCRRTYKYRAYPNQTQLIQLDLVLCRCRDLYNACLQQRREAWRLAHKSLSYYDQQNELPALRAALPEYQALPSHVLQDVVRRVDRAYQGFFRRLKTGAAPGFPRYLGRGRYHSFTYPDRAGWKLRDGRLYLTGLGDLNVRFHRPLDGTIKTLTVCQEGTEWYVAFSCEVPITPLLPTEDAVGVDLGVSRLATLSTGEMIAHPRYLRQAQARLARTQRQLARCQRGSKRRARVKQRLSRQHQRVRRQRADFLHKQARHLVQTFGLIVFEDLAIQNLLRRAKPKIDTAASADSGTPIYAPNGQAARTGRNQAISDAGWRMFQQLCVSKAAWASRAVVFVNPAYTSQVCSGCGAIRKKTLAERQHVCPCGCVLDRDVNAAINILRAGKRLMTSAKAVSADTEV